MNSTQKEQDDMLPEYNFDYTKAKSNRFAAMQPQAQVSITLDSDVARFFTTSEVVNQMLRAIIVALPVHKKMEKI